MSNNNSKINELLDSGIDYNSVDDESGTTLLMFAVYEQDIESVERLVSGGADVNIQNKEGETALSRACQLGNLHIVQILLENNANVNIQDLEGYTALAKALDNHSIFETGLTEEHREIIRLLIKNGADVNLNPIGEISVLSVACVLGDIEIVQMLIEHGADVNADDGRGSTPLVNSVIPIHLAEDFLNVDKNIDENKNVIIDLLIQHGADVNVVTNGSMNALVLACIFGNIKTVEHLIEVGANVNMKIQSDMSLLAFILMASEKMFKLIAASYSSNIETLFLEFENKKFKLASILIDNGANLNDGIPDMALLKMCSINKEKLLLNMKGNIEEKEARRTIFNRMNLGDIDVAKFIIKEGADVDIQDTEGITPLMVASVQNHIEMVKLLLESGANVNMEDNNGTNAYTFGKKYKEVTKLLVAYGINLVDTEEKRVLRMSEKEKQDYIQVQKESSALSKEKLKNHWDAMKENLPETQMTKVLKSKDLKELKNVIDSGYDTSSVDLFDLIKDDYPVEFIEIILKNGTDVNIEHKESDLTPLMFATLLNKVEIVKLLVVNGADVDWKNKNGKEAYYFSKNEEMIKILLNPSAYRINRHMPKELVKILTNFRKDTPIKYTTHDWDMGFKGEYGDFKGFISKVTKEWNKIEEELKLLSPRLHTKIYNFLINTDPNSKSWCSKDGDDISIGWSSLEGLDAWCNKGNDHLMFKLGKPYKIEGKTITTFGEVINLFKQEIQIRREDDVLENIFIDMAEKLDEEFDGLFEIEVIKLKKKQFYTDVEVFKNVVNTIFNEIKQNRAYGNIKVEIEEDIDDVYYDLKIIQMGSESGIGSRAMLNLSDGGSSSIIRESLQNICNWSIESSHEGENYCINYLKDSNTQEVEVLAYKPEGFTHILRFYR